MKFTAPKYKSVLGIVFLVFAMLISCSKDDSKESEDPDPIDPTDDTPAAFDINSITDTYYNQASVDNVWSWGYRNVHDPSVIKEGEYYYCYSTDVAFGATVQPGIQVRKSSDLIQWTFVDWVFSGLPAMGSNFIEQSGGEPFNALWAPYIMKVGNEFRLYYSLSSAIPRLSVIGLATATSPMGPWTEKGLVVVSKDDASIQTNAIDPTVVIDQAGSHWMFYGSAWDGIYKLQLNPSTGLALYGADKGVRVAQRGFTGNSINGNIEGPEVIYNAQFNKYYLFIAYDWLQTKYNVRVGRSDSAEGPFTDFDGNDINTEADHGPMIIAPYKFNGHSGWQGVAHCSVFEDGTGQYYMAHQGRPGENSFFMDLHVRQMHWTEDGWPIVSPERYAGVSQNAITSEDLVGSYEQIIFGYNVVPGYSAEQTSADFQVSTPLQLNADGTVNGDSSTTWTFASPWLTLNSGGSATKLHVERGRDWENHIESTILFSGLNESGTTIWGKKTN